jgi:hypothetical protein
VSGRGAHRRRLSKAIDSLGKITARVVCCVSSGGGVLVGGEVFVGGHKLAGLSKNTLPSLQGKILTSLRSRLCRARGGAYQASRAAALVSQIAKDPRRAS